MRFVDVPIRNTGYDPDAEMLDYVEAVGHEYSLARAMERNEAPTEVVMPGRVATPIRSYVDDLTSGGDSLEVPGLPAPAPRPVLSRRRSRLRLWWNAMAWKFAVVSHWRARLRSFRRR